MVVNVVSCFGVYISLEIALERIGIGFDSLLGSVSGAQGVVGCCQNVRATSAGSLFTVSSSKVPAFAGPTKKADVAYHAIIANGVCRLHPVMLGIWDYEFKPAAERHFRLLFLGEVLFKNETLESRRLLYVFRKRPS